MAFDESSFSSKRSKKNWRFPRYLLYGFLLISLLVFFSNRVSPAFFWPAGFLAPLAPLFYLLNVLLLIALLFVRPLGAALVGVILVVGFSIVSKSYQLNNISNRQASFSFRVLSYNVSFFFVPTVFSEQYRSPTHNMNVVNAINWIKQDNADILCLQEFFDDQDSDIYNTVENLTDTTSYTTHFVYKDQVKNKTRRGLIILSKFPIEDKGVIFTSQNHYNGAIYADVRTPQGIVRVVNVHLESMRLSSRKRNPFAALVAYKRGIVTHAKQTEDLISFLRQSPYQLVLCGDINETPYSYVYHQLASVLHNAFEEAGQGFGVTYLGKNLSFLRIDQQFYSSDFDILRFVTHKDITFSQHVPIEASYSF